ncbi:MAG: TonB-dependent receptor [Parvularculaceae bacterium]|nr:TonB-dependent receptor [Parvularculaceae bacterium]
MSKRKTVSGSLSVPLFAGVSVFALAAAGPVAAQDDEIIVTATKRAESIQDVPLAITVVSSEFIREVNLEDVKDLVTYTPGITGNSLDSFIDFINVRGIVTNDFGVGGDPSVGFFKNGLYQGRNGAVVTTLYDLDRAEALRGPQGFLFGRNAIAGAISVHTARPKLGVVEGYAELDLAERGRVVGEAALNLPLTEKFAVRLAGYGGKENGYVDNAFDPSADPFVSFNKGAGRFSALYEDGPFNGFLTLEYEKRNQSPAVYRATEAGDAYDALVSIFGLTLGGNGRDIDSDFGLGEADDSNIFSAGLELNLDAGAVTLTSLTGFKDHDYLYAEDFDGTPLRINDYRQDQSGQYFEQEVRVISDTDGPLAWYAGASYYNEEIDAVFSQGSDEEFMCQYYFGSSCSDYFALGGYTFTPSAEGLVESNAVRGRYHGWAGYVDATYAFNEKFDIGAGVRYSRDVKDFGIRAFTPDSELGAFFALGFTTTDFLTDKQTWDAFTPRFIARYRPNDDWLIFASATRGFKAGGFGSFTIEPDSLPFTPAGLDLGPGDALPDPFDPEKAWSYEVGTKGALFGGRSKVDANVYYYTYKDLQSTVPGVGGGIVVDNVGKVKGWGVEGQMDTALTDNFSLLFNGAYHNSDVTNAEALCDGTLDCEGQPLSAAPRFSGAAVLRFTAPIGKGAVRANAEAFGQTETFGGLLRLDEARNKGYIDLAFRAGYEADAGWSIYGYVENVTNALYYTGTEEGGAPIPARFIGPSRPRTFGMRISYAFGG